MITGIMGLLIAGLLIYISWKLIKYDAGHNRKPGPPPAESLDQQLDRISRVNMTRPQLRRIKKMMKKNPRLKHLVKSLLFFCSVNCFGQTDTVETKALVSINDTLMVKPVKEVRRAFQVWGSECSACISAWITMWDHVKYLTIDYNELPDTWIVWMEKPE